MKVLPVQGLLSGFLFPGEKTHKLMETKRRVILADDEKHIRAMMKAVISSMNCEIVGEAADGQEAVNLYKKEKPDLLLLDINMPQKSGIDGLREIMREFPAATVIMLTSVVDMENVKQCIELGAANYMRKDTSVTEMRQIIKDTLEGLH